MGYAITNWVEPAQFFCYTYSIYFVTQKLGEFQMQAYSIETTVNPDGTVLLNTLPFLAGETVQVIILPSKPLQKQPAHRSLKGSVLAYNRPFDPVAEDDWAILQ